MNLLRMLQRSKSIHGESALLDEDALTTEVDSKLTISKWIDWICDSQAYHMNIVLSAAQDYFGSKQTISYVSGTQEYSFQGNEIQIRAIERTDTSPDRIIHPININERLLHEPRYNDWNAFRVPEYSYIWGNMLGIAPKPTVSATDNVNILYIRRLPNLMYGTATSAAATNIIFPETPDLGRVSNEDDYYNGATVKIISSTLGAGQRVKITDYAGSTRTATVAWPTTPTGTIVYEIVCDIPEQYHEAVYLYAAILAGISDREDLSNHKGHHADLVEQMVSGLVPRSSQECRSVVYIEE